MMRLHKRKFVASEWRFSMGIVAALGVAGAHAGELKTDNPDWAVRFDNTIKVSTMYRLSDADARLVNSFDPGIPQALNFNAGDDNFRNKGIVSKRVDLLSEFDAVYQKRMGMRLSAAAWYDGAYRGKTDAQDRPGPTSIPSLFTPGNGQAPYNEFPDATKKLAGRKAELLDAFLFGGWDIGEQQKLTVRLGRHALQYGESVFFGDNGIARAQAPIDVMKLQSSPNAQFKEVVRPVPQVSAQWQLNADVAIGGYYQFRWEADRVAPSGSYFNATNNIWGSSPPEYFSITDGPIAGDYLLSAGGDRKPPNSGQFGLQLKWRADETDLGFYAARYHDKSGQFFSALNFADPSAGSWFYVFPKSVDTLGVSASRTLGETNFSLEASLRRNMPLVNQSIVMALGDALPPLATGRTAHVNLSWLSSLPSTALAKEATMIGELAWNRVLSKDDPGNFLDLGRTRDATAVHVVVTPTYRQVVSGLDLNVPLGLRYVIDGRSSITGLSWGPRGTGTASIGLDGDYEGVWQFTSAYVKFIGKAAPFLDYHTLEYSHGNTLADRDYVSFSLRRSF